MRAILQGLFWWGQSVQAPIAYMADVLNISHEKHVKIKIYNKAEQDFSFLASKKDWGLLAGALPPLAQEASVTPPRLMRLRTWCLRRIGLLLGGWVAGFLVTALSDRVWDIRIAGNEALTDTQVLDMLGDCGLEIGSAFSNLQTKAVARDVCLLSQELSYVSINRRGTVVYVHVMERNAPQNDEAHAGGCSNLVATADGVIEDLAVRQGTVLVHRGQVVKKGDLLVSGMREGADGTQLFHADGEVYGRVERRIEIVLPRNLPVNQEKMRRTVGFSYVFFGKTINIFANTGNLPPTYDTIYEKEQWYIGGEFRLPFYSLKTVAIVYEPEETTLADEALVSLAHRRMEEALQQMLREGELLCKKTYGHFTEEAYVLVCDISCLENIATSVEFDSR